MNTAFAIDSTGSVFKDQVTRTSLTEQFVALRELLSTSTELPVAWNYFQEEMAMRLEFVTQGRWGENAMVDAALQGAMKRSGLIGRPILTLTSHIAKHDFWHGIRLFTSKTGLFFFDETIGQGVLAVKENVAHAAVELFEINVRRHSCQYDPSWSLASPSK